MNLNYKPVDYGHDNVEMDTTRGHMTNS